MKKDCSNTAVFLSEWRRMCYSYDEECYGCPLHHEGVCENGDDIISVVSRLEPFANLVQEWSDEHPEYTRADKFFEMFPNAPKGKGGIPNLCLANLGWSKDDDCPNISCFACWNRQYKEVEE